MFLFAKFIWHILFNKICPKHKVLYFQKLQIEQFLDLLFLRFSKFLPWLSSWQLCPQQNLMEHKSWFFFSPSCQTYSFPNVRKVNPSRFEFSLSLEDPESERFHLFCSWFLRLPWIGFRCTFQTERLRGDSEKMYLTIQIDNPCIVGDWE